VAAHYQKNGYRLLRWRWKTPFAEVDLFFADNRRPTRKVLVEVKRRKDSSFRDYALGPKQEARLKRVQSWLSDSGHIVEFQLAFVDQNGKIEIQTEVFG